MNTCPAISSSFAGELYPAHLLHIFPYVHYPFYRISLCARFNIIASPWSPLSKMFTTGWQSSFFQHFSDHLRGNWAIPGGLSAPPLQRDSDGQQQVPVMIMVIMVMVEIMVIVVILVVMVEIMVMMMVVLMVMMEIASRCLRYILPSLLAALVVNGSRYFVILIVMFNTMVSTMMITMITTIIRFFETETASICLDFTECGPCYETATWA